MKKYQPMIVKETGNCYEVFFNQKSADNRLYYSHEAYQHPLLLTEITGNYMVIPNPAPGQRIYFAIKADTDFIYAATTFIPLEKTENLRDMGGYLTTSRKAVKWGHFYRSGALLPTNDSEKIFLDSLHLKSILDYRSQDEVDKAIDYLPKNTCYFNIPAFHVNPELKSKMENMNMAEQLKMLSSPEDIKTVEKEFRSIYKLLPFSNPTYQKMFQLLIEQQTPLLQHCSAGKDRTGVGCALLLLALGVDEETIIGDYCLSALYRESVNKEYITQMKAKGLPDFMIKTASMLLSVQKDFIEDTLTEIKLRYADYNTFFYEEYDINKVQLEELRNFYLVKNQRK